MCHYPRCLNWWHGSRNSWSLEHYVYSDRKLKYFVGVKIRTSLTLVSSHFQFSDNDDVSGASQTAECQGISWVSRSCFGYNSCVPRCWGEAERPWCRIISRIPWFIVRLRPSSPALFFRDGSVWYCSLPCVFPSISSRGVEVRRRVVSLYLLCVLSFRISVCPGGAKVSLLVVSLYDTNEADT